MKKSATIEFQPIVEFFPIDSTDRNRKSNLFDDTANADQKQLKKVLLEARGIYAFYNSEAEIIYVGKTEKQNLWKRMKKSYGDPSRYERYYVSHPNDQYKPPKNGVRKIIRRGVQIYEVATFCSAYVLPMELISFAEKLLLRLIPNDLINLRMEGNVSLKPFLLNSKTSTK